MSSTHEILILGGHHAGLGVAHYILRHVIPKLSKANPSTNYHVTIVSPNTEFYWNIAAPRLIVSETLIPEENAFLPISDGFKSYDASLLTFAQGKATSLDPETKSVSISNGSTITYSSLVIATGSSYVDPVWSLNDHEEALKKDLHSTRSALKAAKTVLLAGGGAVGVETAGEIAAEYPSHDTTLLSGTSRLLPRLLASNSAAAESRLSKMGIKTVHDLKVTNTKKNADGTTSVTLSDGSSRTVDVYIDCTGGKPNTSFLPSSWLTPSKHVQVDSKTLRSSIPGVYAIGDAASYSDGSVIAVKNSVIPLGTSIAVDLAKAAGADAEKECAFVQKTYKPMKDTQFVPTGPSGGVGQVMGWKIPSLAVWAAKSRTYFVWMAKGTVEGGDFMKA